MKAFIIIVIVAMLVIGLFFALSTPTEEASQQTTTNSQSAEQYDTIASEVSSNEAVLLDVRTPEEYSGEHAVDAINYSLQDMQAGSLPDYPKDQRLYVYCRSGNRSAQAATILRQAGYSNVVDLGGVEDMRALGAPFTN